MYNAVKNSIALTFRFVILSQWAVFYPVFVGNPLAYPDAKQPPTRSYFSLGSCHFSICAITTFSDTPST